jgi:hypothetical protein
LRGRENTSKTTEIRPFKVPVKLLKKYFDRGLENKTNHIHDLEKECGVSRQRGKSNQTSAAGG